MESSPSAGAKGIDKRLPEAGLVAPQRVVRAIFIPIQARIDHGRLPRKAIGELLLPLSAKQMPLADVGDRAVGSMTAVVHYPP